MNRSTSGAKAQPPSQDEIKARIRALDEAMEANKARRAQIVSAISDLQGESRRLDQEYSQYNWEYTRILREFAEVVASVADCKKLYRRVDELELTVRSANGLKRAGIKFIGDLVEKSEAEMKKIENFGDKSLKEVKLCLAEMGLGFGMVIPGWERPST